VRVAADGVSELCAELAGLYRALGAATVPDVPGAPDRSSQARGALLWCTTHEVSHRRDEWRDAAARPPVSPEDWCVPGQDPRRASVLVAPALAATAPRWSQAHRAWGPSSPADDGMLSIRDEVECEVLGLARYARRALGHTGRDRDPVRALGRLPGLLALVSPGHPLHRRARGVLEPLRRRARVALDLDRRPLTLGECPSLRIDPYAATWVPREVGAEWVWVPAAEWADGVCREYDGARSRPDADPPVDVWRRSILYCRDPAEAVGSEGRAIRCPGCRRVWRTAEEFAQLHGLLRPDRRESPQPGQWPCLSR